MRSARTASVNSPGRMTTGDAVARRPLRQILVAKLAQAAAMRHQSHHRLGKRRLARTVGAGDRHDLAGIHDQIDAADDVHLAIAGTNAAQFQQVHVAQVPT